jgi:phosphomannomutase/phosphoglucomutase
MKVDRVVFRGYDIRGYAYDAPEKNIQTNLTPELALCIGKALGSRLQAGSTVVVSGDHRDSTPALREAVVNGYISTCVNVHLDNQPVPSAANNWYLIRHNLDGAVQISGSHNPWYFNGLKISEGTEALYGDRLKELIEVIESDSYRVSASKGKVENISIVEPYMNMLRKAFPDPLKCCHRIILDAGNGLGGLLAPVLQEKGADVLVLLGKPDGGFPYHDADPSSTEAAEIVVQSLKDTNKGIKDASRRWYGILTDGDADRSGFVAEDGEVVWPEKMAAIFYREYLQNKEYKGRVMALDVRASNVAMRIVEENGGRGFFIPAGYPSHRMFARLIDSDIGKEYPTGTSAEASGHFFYPTASSDENSDFVEHAADILIDDGLYSALKFVYILDSFKSTGAAGCSTLKELTETVPGNPTWPEIRVDCPDEDKFGVVDQIKEQIKRDYADQLKPIGEPVLVGKGKETVKAQEPKWGIIEVDGVRAQFRDGSWLLIRASNTVPMLTLKFEAPTQDLLLQRMKEVDGILSVYPQINRTPLQNAVRALHETIH